MRQKKGRLLRQLLAMLLIAGLMAVPGFAASNTFTEGESVSWIMASEGYEVADCWVDTSLLPPGTSMSVNYDIVVLTGTPNVPGTYDFYLDVYYSTPDGILNEGCSVTVTVTAANPATPVPAASNSNTAPAPDPEPEPEPAASNSNTAPDPGPTQVPPLAITKHPTGETVEAGESALFIARANNASQILWCVEDPDGNTYGAAEAPDYTSSGLYVGGQNTESLSLGNIPESMDGWYVYCIFIGLDGTGSATTDKARITVTEPSASPSPAQEVSPSPTQTAKPGLGAAKGDGSSDRHEHSFDGPWQWDDRVHWKECECGERGEEAEHEFIWSVTREAGAKAAGEQLGVCGQCGCEVTAAVEREEKDAPARDKESGGKAGSSAGSVGLIVALCAAGLVLAAAAALLCVMAVRKSAAKKTFRYHCDKCGWEPRNQKEIPRFCPNCGDPVDEKDRAR